MLFTITCVAIFIFLENKGICVAEKPNEKREVVLVHSLDYPPLFYVDEDGVSRGALIDYWRLWAEKTGVGVRFEAMLWHECVERGRRDEDVIIPGIFYTPERDAFLDFSQSFIDIKTSLFLKKSLNVKNQSDLKGITVGVTKGDRVLDFLKEKMPELRLKTFEGFEVIVKAASKGEVDAFAMDNLCAEYHLNRYNSSDDFKHFETLYVGKFCAGVREGNQLLLRSVNNGIEQIKKEEVDDILERWLSRAGLVSKDVVKIILIITGIALVFLILSYLLLLRRQVRKRTNQLSLKAKALEESESKYRSVFENTGTVTVIIEEDMTISMANSEIEILTGYRKFDIEGRMKIVDFLLEEDLQKGAEYHKARRGDGPQPPTDYEIRIKDRFGDIRDVLIKVAVIPGTRQSVASIQDITFLKKAQDDKEKMQKRLQHARKMEAIGVLAGGVAHDLNNILSGVVSYPDLLLMNMEQGSPFQKPLTTIKEAGQKAATMVEDLLTLARRGVPSKEPVNLNQIVKEYIDSPEFKSLISFHPQVDVAMDLNPDLFNISGSSIHLSKTVMNLVSNAAEAMPDGGKIIVKTQNRYIDDNKRLREGQYAEISVSDNGSGISTEDMDRIFEPFYTKKVMGRSGTGLGMAVVWGTVQDHDGHIDIKSGEGKGTAISIVLPITGEEPKEKNPSPVIEEYMGRGESILVVDDVKEQREIASAILSELGYSVKSVSSGEEAVHHLKSSSADLVLLDMIMEPGMDGYETYKSIIRIYPGQKAIIASGYSENAMVKKAQDLGAGEYIKKPYTMEKIGVAVRTELDR